MRWRFVAVAVISVAAFGAQSAHASVIQMTPNNIGLVGYWSFNESTSTIAHDYSGNGNNGTLSGSPLPTWVAGKLGRALQFDGATNYAQTGSTDILDSNYAGTVAFWIKTSTTGYVEVFDYSNLTTNNAALVEWDIDGGQVTMGMKRDAPGNWDNWVWNTTINDNKWHHVVYVADGTNPVVVYVDGVPATLSSFNNHGSGGASSDWVADSYNISGITNMFVIGAEHRGSDAPNSFFPGSIDEVHIYNRTLSATQVAGLYQSGLAKINSSQSPGTLSQGLVGWWTMDGADTVWSSPTAGTEADRSGNGNTGTLTSMNRATSPVLGKIGQALQFDGSSSYINLGNNPSIQRGLPVTISAWMKASDLTALATNDCVVATGGSLNNYSGATLQFYGNSIETDFGDNGSPGPSNRESKIEPITSNANTWYHVVGVIRGAGDMNLYVNGADVGGSYSGSGGAIAYSTDPATIGSTAWHNGICPGAIDDVRVYDRALSASEVQQLYNVGAGTHVNTSSQNLQNGSTLANGLVGMWTFDGGDISGSTIYDLSGNGNNGTNYGAVPAIGKLGQAMSFNGSTSYIDAGTASSLRPSQFTVTAWVYPTGNSGNGYQGILSDSVWGDYYGYSLNVNGTLKLFAEVQSSSATSDTTPYQLTLNTWYYVTETYTSSALIVYVNGTQVAQVSSPAAIAYEAGDSFSVGTFAGSPPAGGHFNGKVDDVRVYNRALSASEVQYLYNMGK